MQCFTVLAMLATVARCKPQQHQHDSLDALDADDDCHGEARCAIEALQLKALPVSFDEVDDQASSPDFCSGQFSDECLCVFDIDRTLTSKQGASNLTCRGSKTMAGVEDNAYGGGELRFSALSAEGLNDTFCASCFLGLCSHGDANNAYSPERKAILDNFLRTEKQTSLQLVPDVAWSDEPHLSPYVVRHPDGEKQFAVESILKWYARHHVCISRRNTYFFDDRANNVLPFKGTGMNAKQVSCTSRDGDFDQGAVGLCGATPAEITRQVGIGVCNVDCQWHDWAPWSLCSATCGEATKQRKRRVYIAQAGHGKECSGSKWDTEACSLDACPDTLQHVVDEEDERELKVLKTVLGSHIPHSAEQN